MSQNVMATVAELVSPISVGRAHQAGAISVSRMMRKPLGWSTRDSGVLSDARVRVK
ncbi:hypothetical protein [Streptomyces microflavus]|uniref:hypothetical protein n=1 Tax=Streptomyces microflavus TaxID=1919 RepID=UPI003B21F723